MVCIATSPPGSACLRIGDFVAYRLRPELADAVDVFELLVGEGGAGKSCARRRTKCGAKFDLVIACYLTREEQSKRSPRGARLGDVHTP